MKIVPLQVSAKLLGLLCLTAGKPIAQAGIASLCLIRLNLSVLFVQKHTPVPLYWPKALYGPLRVSREEIMAFSSGLFWLFLGV